MRLEDLKEGLRVKGLRPNVVTLIQVKQRGPNAVNIIFRQEDNSIQEQTLLRTDEQRLEIVTERDRWAFDADGEVFRVISEAYRIQQAHLFDPLLAVHTSKIEPLPHQITAVYQEMLTRQPLRYVLADDPGAGKTIMAGLLIRELRARGDVERCLICAPGNLTQQWQDELAEKFQLQFDIMGRDMIENSRSGNPFGEHDSLIVRLDQLSRSPELQAQLGETHWDLIICDEAHKMSASYAGIERSETKRYKLGKLLGQCTRHFLLMTATPHNGKEDDFQLFLALLDADRFEGRGPEDPSYKPDVTDLMRRLTKERLVRFDGKPLFPERRAYTVDYPLSEDELRLYNEVTAYVSQEFNRAEQLENAGRKSNVGFALTVLQRRLASSPEAIYQSLKRRRERLEERLSEARAARQTQLEALHAQLANLDLDDLEEATDDETDQHESEVIAKATAANTIDELDAEIQILRHIEDMARRLRNSGVDRKWSELGTLLNNNAQMRDGSGRLRKLVIFTEHRDTLNYLRERLGTMLADQQAIVTLHGGTPRDQRRMIENQFRNDPDVTVLLATDAAGEGINLQRAHLMVNYDLPWNPNRLEQRFGRIHRIGQTEVCHLWNLIAGQTREGNVYQRLLSKLQAERNALGGQVFDVLGSLFQDKSLRELMIEAIRYGDDPAVKSRLDQAIDSALDTEHLRQLIQRHALVETFMTGEQVSRVREEMERAQARRLQPHYIKSFFLQGAALLNLKLYQREPGRYEVRHIPEEVYFKSPQRRANQLARKYERICFDKALIHAPGSPNAEFVYPGHPLMNVILAALSEAHPQILKRGAVLIDETDSSDQPHILLYVMQGVQDATNTILSREVHFVESHLDGRFSHASGAPYLDYRPATDTERAFIDTLIDPAWLSRDHEARAIEYATQHLLPPHLERVTDSRTQLLDKTEHEVTYRLMSEIRRLDDQANKLRQQERNGKINAKQNSTITENRANELQKRLKRRKDELDQQRQTWPTSPSVIGGALIVPVGMLRDPHTPPELIDRQVVEQAAMQAVMSVEAALGNHPIDVSKQHVGYDIESFDPRTGTLRFIEVKGRKKGAEDVTMTRNEILTALNTPESFILALVEVDGGTASAPRYIRRPFGKEPDFGVTSVNYRRDDLLAVSEDPV